MSTATDKNALALEYAAKQLTYRPLSVKLLREKLKSKGHGPEAVEHAIGWLTEHNMLNDTEYARLVVQSFTEKGCGAARIRMELRKRGVGKTDAELAMESYAPDWEQMRAVIDKRLRGDVSDRKEIDKTIAALSRRGFSWPEIHEALSQYGGLES